mmetsp:Transcript_14863/g.26818  ORF Transcript_14863/g.26818 Transcript_14863/m.26818 type:complete len:295 (+) Transcript_14863:35-919(+)
MDQQRVSCASSSAGSGGDQSAGSIPSFLASTTKDQAMSRASGMSRMISFMRKYISSKPPSTARVSKSSWRHKYTINLNDCSHSVPERSIASTMIFRIISAPRFGDKGCRSRTQRPTSALSPELKNSRIVSWTSRLNCAVLRRLLVPSRASLLFCLTIEVLSVYVLRRKNLLQISSTRFSSWRCVSFWASRTASAVRSSARSAFLLMAFWSFATCCSNFSRSCLSCSNSLRSGATSFSTCSLMASASFSSGVDDDIPRARAAHTLQLLAHYVFCVCERTCTPCAHYVHTHSILSS